MFSVPPKINHKKPVHKKVVEGSPVELPCDASGKPTPTFTWQKGTRKFTSQQGYCFNLVINGFKIMFHS
jgi:hypothetical protein